MPKRLRKPMSQPSPPRTLVTRPGPALNQEQSHRLVELLATGLERYLHANAPVEKGLAIPDDVCVYTHHADGATDQGE
jgi:hypothetical protein